MQEPVNNQEQDPGFQLECNIQLECNNCGEHVWVYNKSNRCPCCGSESVSYLTLEELLRIQDALKSRKR